jgi:xylulokinase
MNRHVLAIDHGTSGIKAAIVSERGEVVDSDFEATPIHFFEGGGAEQDPDDWWRALLETSRRLVARASVPRESIEAMCVSSTFSSTVAVGEDGRHLMPSLTWMDSRGAPHVARMVGGFPSFQGYNVWTAWRWVRKTAGIPSLSGKDDAAHVLYVKSELPEVYERTRVFLPSKDYLNLRLTGETAATFDSIHLFWVTDTRDIDRIAYDDELITALGIDRAKLPPLVASTDVLGPILPDVAAAIGLEPTVKVVAGSPDHQCACIGAGCVRDFDAHLYIGTSSWIECMVPFKKTDPLHSIASFPTALAGRYQCIDEQDLAGGALSFLADNLLFHPTRLGHVSRPADPYAVIDEMVRSVSAGSGGVLFTPWLNGERTPVDDPNLRGGFHDLSTTTNLAHMARAVLEGVAYNTRWALEYVDRFVGKRLDPLVMVGGGAQSEVWCQTFADVLGREMRVATDPRQANARGAAFIAGMGLGWLDWDDLPELVPVVRTHSPDTATSACYRDGFDRYLDLCAASRRRRRWRARNRWRAS